MAHEERIFGGILGGARVRASSVGGRSLRDGLCGLSSCSTGMELKKTKHGWEREEGVRHGELLWRRPELWVVFGWAWSRDLQKSTSAMASSMGQVQDSMPSVL